MADFFGRQLTGEPATVTDNVTHYLDYHGLRINYSHERLSQQEYLIKPHGLLHEKGIRPQSIDCFAYSGSKAFFRTDGDIVFDIFAASFYLLSRYEEYLPHTKDIYGRYAHENSVAYKESFLNKPLINYWLLDFKRSLQLKFTSLAFHDSPFTFLPTYDIDEAYSYKYKQWWRSAGAAIKDILSAKWKRFRQRRSVLNGEQTDPFDSFAWMDDLHRPYKLKPRYFFLVAERTKKYDRNILPTVSAMQTLIQQHSEKYAVGIHPSWQSGDDSTLLIKEIGTLERITKQKITSSRQHFIRFTLPQTYRQLSEAGIKEDFSMGYGSINGFRASVASPFYWYDLEKEEQTYLLLYPFCYMEANSFFEQKQTPQQALEEMLEYYQTVKAVRGTMISVWHNTFLGTDELYKGWRDAYYQFFNHVMKE
jgi:hypothetical protein